MNRVARIEAAGHGAQILLSSAVSALVGTALPSGTQLVDLGTHLQRGLTEPEQIRQLSVEGLRTSFPPLRTGSTIETHLPDPSTSFVGREDEVRDTPGARRNSQTRKVATDVRLDEAFMGGQHCQV